MPLEQFLTMLKIEKQYFELLLTQCVILPANFLHTNYVIITQFVLIALFTYTKCANCVKIVKLTHPFRDGDVLDYRSQSIFYHYLDKSCYYLRAFNKTSIHSVV